MNPTKTLPVLAVLGPQILAIAPPLLIGAGIAAGVLWLLRDDKAKAADDAPATEPPAAASETPPRPTWGEEVDVEWGFTLAYPLGKPTPEPPPAAAEPPRELTEAERAARRAEREARRVEKAEAAFAAARARENTAQAAANAKHAAEVAAARVPRQLATPVVTMQARPAVSGVAAPSPVPTLTAATAALAALAAPPRAAAAAESVSVGSKTAVAASPATASGAAPRKFQLNPPKVTRADLAAIFDNGAKRLTRQAAVAALRARGVGQTAAYTALRNGGRFAAALDVGADGLLALRASI